MKKIITTIIILSCLSVSSRAQFPPVAAFTASDTIICTGDSVIFTDQSTESPFAWSWSFQGGTPANSILQAPDPVVYNTAGTYDVTLMVFNAFGGDTLTKTGYITVNPKPVIDSLTSVDASCGNADGSASVYVSGGSPGYTYQWDDVGSQTTATATGLAAGTYGVTVTDASGICSAIGTISVNDAGAPAVTISSFTNSSSCVSPCDGDATASVTGGITPYTYLWDDPLAQNTATADSLCVGTYTVTVTDSAGCIAIASVTISEPGGPTAGISFFTDVSCGGSCDGDATVAAFGGATPYTYLWDDSLAQTTATADSLCIGTYNVTVTDANGCSDTATAIISDAGAPTAFISGTTAANCGACDGDATVTVFGGTTPYTYLWNDPLAQTTVTADSLCPGSYVVDVSDANGCSTTSDTATINALGGPIVTVASNNPICPGGCDGDATASVVGGTTPYTYLWDDPLAQTTATADGLCAGTYTVIVTDDGGCSNSASITLNDPAGMTLSTSTIAASCDTADGSATVTATGGAIPYTYQWNDPLAQTTSTADSLAAGIYMVVVTDANGCSDSASATVNNLGGPTVFISGSTDVSCNGGSDGSATVTASGGTTPYTYQWDDPANQSTAIATGLSVGSYTVAVTDANGCIGSAGVTINEPAPLVVTVTGTDPVCNGSCDGSATASVTGGTSPYTYQWDDPSFQTTQTADNLCAGTYSVNITDANGCSTSSGVVINDPAGMSLTTSTTDATCGNADGSASVSVSGGTTPYSYQWDDPSSQTTATATGLASGGYAVTVTDANGCTDAANVSINDIGGPSAAISTSTDVSCNGGNDGSATVSATGGTTPYTYQWDDPLNQTTATATGLTAGTYNVIVTDANGCSASASVTINEPTALNAAITSSTDASCNGACDGDATVSASGGVSPYTYQWDDPNSQITATANNLCVGAYNVTVTDANGCTAIASVSINEPAALTVSVTGTDPACPGACDGDASASVTGGTSPYTYQWDDPLFQVTATATGLCAGTYSVVVTDVNGCNTSSSIVINDPAGMALTTSTTDATCGNADGSATVSVTGGTIPYTYLWNDPLAQTTATATGLAAGGYSVTVTDFDGCTEIANATINDIGGPSAAISSSTDVSCNGGNDGSATVSATGGTTPYTYQWDDPLTQTTATATGLSAGTYNILVTDSNGCSASASVAIDEPAALNAIITSSSDVSCNGGSDGEATVSVSGGVSPYTYQWDDPNSQIAATATGLAAGTYTVNVTDANGCVDIAGVTITEPAALSISITGTDPTCPGACDGQATASVTGGTSPYTYQWNDPLFQVSATAVGLCAGTYTVTVTDANGCTFSTSVILSEPASLILSTSSTDATCGNADGSATVAVSGGTAPYTYQWDDPSTQVTATATGLSAGGYSVTVTDANGCFEIANVTINDIGGPTVGMSSSTDVSCNGGNDGSATSSASGGNSPYTYQWDDPISQTSETATGLSAGIYNVVVTDSTGCSASASVTINEPTALNAGITSSTDASCNGACDGEATVGASGGISPYTYQWDDPNSQITATANNLCVGTYNVIVTDANGCSSIASVSINEPAALVLSVTGTDPACPGACDGQATASVTGGNSPYTYQWNDPDFQITATATGLCAGTYTVVVTDANGCNLSSNIVINDPSGMALTTSTTDATCGNTDGSASVSVTGGFTPYTYLWDDPSSQTIATAAGLAAGGYSVIVTDANGCNEVANATVNDVGGASLSASGLDVSCNSGNDGVASVTATGGTAPYTYLWDDPSTQTTGTATGLTAGTYNVVVTDNTGCSSSASVIIDEPAALNATITSIANVSCNGGNDGSAAVSVSGGVIAYTYQWDDTGSQTTATATGLFAGTYNITVTDANGCVVTASATITEPAVLSVAVTGTDPACSGDCDGAASATVTGGTVPYSYQWDDASFQVTQTAVGLCAGTYNVTITDGNGCTSTANIAISDPAGMSLTTSVSDASCGSADGSASVSVTGGATPYSYQWDDPLLQTTATADSLAAGAYSVTVTDANGCTAAVNVTINDTGGPSLIMSGTDVSCTGCNDGSATVSATGRITPYTYQWDDPLNQITATATGLSAGTYNVLVTDSAGCSSSASITISEPISFNTIISSTNVVCNGACDGTATVTVSGGTSPYTYQWDDPGSQTNATATGLCVGSYSVTVTDADGNTSMESVTIFQPSAMLLTATATDATCGNFDGSATVGVTGGTPGYAYSWSSGGNLATENNLSLGAYSVTVTDANGCSETAGVTVINSNAPAIAVTSSDVSCNGGNDGSVTVTVTGGTSPYSYQWNDPSSQTTATAAALTAGTYTVTVTDSNGCANIDSAIVNEPVALSATTAVNDATLGACDGDATATASGGTSPYTYLWNDPAAQTTATATGLCAGDYTVTVTDANGCTAIVSDTVGTFIGITEQNLADQFSIYPNPADDFITINIDLSESSEVEIQLHNVVGELVYSSSLGKLQNMKYELNLTEFQNGIYFVKLATLSGSANKKVIINK